ASALSLRRDPRLLKLPPYLSLLCIVVGVVWLFLLPLDDYSRRTYISENALLPGQVHTYFGGSDQNVFRAYKHETDELAGKGNIEVNDELESIAKGLGLKVGRQNFTYSSASNTHSGQNIYAILQAPRGDATEAIVLVAAWKNVKGELKTTAAACPSSSPSPATSSVGRSGPKDIIFIFTLPTSASQSGALQGAIALDYTRETRFQSVHIVYDGVNGQLPNLDLINSVNHTMLRGMLKQGLGLASGPHSSFIPYHVDAVTLQPFGEGWQDEMAIGRVIEGTFRSLNNLLEHLHQSFFFYLLMQRERFVSIGTYLPSAMLVAANFTIMAIALWVKSGQPDVQEIITEKTKTAEEAERIVSPNPHVASERDLFLPLVLVAVCQFLGVVPLYLFNHLSESALVPAFVLFSVLSSILPFLLSNLLHTSTTSTTTQQYHLIRSFSLLLLGMFLSSLATLNFSLAFFVGVFSAPLTFVRPCPNSSTLKWLSMVVLYVLSPTTVVLVASMLPGLDEKVGCGLGEVLRQAAFAWDVTGTYTPVVVWCVWWPAWIVGVVSVLGRPGAGDEKVKKA
ncbi:Gaa1-like protein, partial [Neurospora crassa]